MSKKRKSRRQSRPKRRHAVPPRVAPTTAPKPLSRESLTATPFEGPQWTALRQGARNVAGVRYQLAVTALLLAESRRRVLPFVEIIPEGFEDIDCIDRESIHWLVQVKDFGAGAGTFTASSIAAVISHAASAPPIPSRIVAITDGRLGTQLAESGWHRPVSETPGYDLQSTTAALVQRGSSTTDATLLLTRTHLVRLPWNVLPRLTTSIADTYDLRPAVATLIAYRLIDTLGQLAADQRTAIAASVGRYRPADLDALVKKTLSVVDLSQLDSAMRLGICDIADYTAQPATEHSRFLQGIDAIPAHIASGFDVLRPGPYRAVQDALHAARYALIAGPSGSGKSTQVWRSARDVSTAVQIVRVHRIATDSDVEELLRHVQLLEPNDAHSVVVCCDDLGRPRTRAWAQAARRLLAIPGVLLLGAVRQEDFTAELLRHGGVLVELRLDDDEATAIATQLTHAGLSLRFEIPEAVHLAAGQLMEFLSLLTTGKRLHAVLADQAESLLRASDPTTLSVARLVCASHVLGVEIAASSLGDALPTAHQPALTPALLRLRDEHIITTEDQSAWRGLHQRRSEVLTELLHRTPPPTQTQTIADVLQIFRPGALGWGLRRVTELYGKQLQPPPDAITPVMRKCTDAAQLASLLEGLERADHSLTACASIPIIEQHRHSKVDFLSWAFLVCVNHLAGIDLAADTEGIFAQLGERVRRCARELPPRSTVYSDAAAAALGPSRLLDSLLAAPFDDVVRLLETVAPYVDLSGQDLNRLSATFQWPATPQDARGRLLRGRFLDACSRASVDPVAFSASFGTVRARLLRACQAHPNAVSVELDEDAHHATVGLLADPRAEANARRLPWDSGLGHDDDDPVNRHVVELATYVGECCPELEIVEIRTVLADGSPLIVEPDGLRWEPGHRRLARNARPRRTAVRINVGVKAAIFRQVAAYSWTQLVRVRESIAELVTDLVADAPRRLSTHDNEGRRNNWRAAVDDAMRRLAELPAPPVDASWAPGRAAANWDVVPSSDGLTDAIRTVATAMQALVAEDPENQEYVRLGAQVGTALKGLRGARTAANMLRTGREIAVYERLTVEVRRLRSLLVSISHDIAIIRRLKAPANQLAAVVDEIVREASSTRLQVESDSLEATFADVPGVVVRDVVGEEALPSSILGHRWIVTACPEAWTDAVTAAGGVDREVVKVGITLVCATADLVLPIALGVSWTNDGVFSIPPQEVSQIASQLGRRTVPGPRRQFFAEVLEDLVLASWKNARMRLRPSEWLLIDEPTAQEHLQRAQERVGLDDRDTALVQVLAEIAGHVEKEILGVGLPPLAAAAAMLPVGVRNTDGNDVAELLMTGTLVALDEELATCFATGDGEKADGTSPE